MPRPARPHLYLDKSRNTYCIRDGSRSIRTGCGPRSQAEAQQKLAAYLASKYQPAAGPSPWIADVMLAYLEHRPKERLCLNNLRPYWGGLRVSDITAARCRDYASGRPPVAGRRDLEVLRAAVNYWDKHVHHIDRKPTVVLPQRPASRTRILTRSEVARLLRVARRTPHLARFLLLAFYTGSRAGAILDLRWSWVDTERGILHRREPGSPERKGKRRPPVKLGKRITQHLIRWRNSDASGGLEPLVRTVIHYEGKPVRKLRRSWRTAVERSGVECSPHDLRRTRVTILMSRGVSPELIGQAVGMSPVMVRDVYAQFDPEWQASMADVDR